jgi:hypothetical protein
VEPGWHEAELVVRAGAAAPTVRLPLREYQRPRRVRLEAPAEADRLQFRIQPVRDGAPLAAGGAVHLGYVVCAGLAGTE